MRLCHVPARLNMCQQIAYPWSCLTLPVCRKPDRAHGVTVCPPGWVLWRYMVDLYNSPRGGQVAVHCARIQCIAPAGDFDVQSKIKLNRVGVPCWHADTSMGHQSVFSHVPACMYTLLSTGILVRPSMSRTTASSHKLAT